MEHGSVDAVPRVRRHPEALSPDHVPEGAAARFADRLYAVLRRRRRERVVVLGPLVDGAAEVQCGTLSTDASLELLLAAEVIWTKQFPKPVSVPEAAVDGKVVGADYADIKAAACAAGSSASVCN